MVLSKHEAGGVTFQGNPLTLVGDEIKVGQPLPDCELLDNSLGAVKLSGYKGKVCIVSLVPSLDTSVCDLQTRRFNEEAAALGEDVVILTVSMDLPFAQARWCGAAGVERVITLSDHREAELGKACGLLIKELRLLARAVLVVDRQGIVRYVQIVREITNQPDYEEAVKAAKSLLQDNT